MVDAGGALRGDEDVEVAPEAQEAGPALPERHAELRDDIAGGAQLPADASRQEASGAGAAVRGAERDERVHALVTAHALDVVAGDDAAHRVADHVNPLVAGLLADRLHGLLQPSGGGAEVLGEHVVVERPDAAETSSAQGAPQHRED